MLAREGRLKAEKMGRNWFTSEKWLAEYFGKQISTDTDKMRISADMERISTDIELRKIEKEEKVALARMQAEVELRRIEKEEKVALSAANTNEPKNLRTEEQPVPKFLSSSIFESQEQTPALELLNLLAREVKGLREEVSQEQSQKQALIFAFENLQIQVSEEIDRRLEALGERLNEKLAKLAIAKVQTPEEEIINDLQRQADEQIRALYSENGTLNARESENLQRLTAMKDRLAEAFGIGEGTAAAAEEADEHGELEKFREEKPAIEPDPVDFQTVFLDNARANRASLLSSRQTERRLAAPEWRREALTPSGTHFFAKHRKFFDGDGRQRETGGIGLTIDKGFFRPALAIGLVGLSAFLLFSAFPLSQEQKNIVSGSLNSAVYILRGTDNIITEVSEGARRLAVGFGASFGNTGAKALASYSTTFNNIGRSISGAFRSLAGGFGEVAGETISDP